MRSESEVPVTLEVVAAEIRHAADNGGANEGRCFQWFRDLATLASQGEQAAGDALAALAVSIGEAAGTRVSLHLTRAKQIYAALAARQPVCATCKDEGVIGGPSFYAPDEGGVPCPDCAARQPVVPTPQQISDYLHGLDAIKREVVEREAIAASQPVGQPRISAYRFIQKGQALQHTVWTDGDASEACVQAERDGVGRIERAYAAPPAQPQAPAAAVPEGLLEELREVALWSDGSAGARSVIRSAFDEAEKRIAAAPAPAPAPAGAEWLSD